MVRFMVAGIRRTGTTLIRTTLNKHPDVRCIGEAFNFKGRFLATHGNEFGYRKYLDARPLLRIQDMFARKSTVQRYLDELYATPGFAAIGFKLMLSQSHTFPMVMEYLRRHDARVIHVVRQNVLKTLISRTVKRKTKVSSSTKAIGKTSITLREDRLLRDLERLDAENEQWARECAGMPYIRVSYEDFVFDKQGELRRLLEFLDINTVPELQSDLVKLTSDNLREVLSNYEAVERKLQGTRFEWCLGGTAPANPTSNGL
ncbi:MAG: sulfotransferase family protein [Candidatus Sumerlaeaceae bacterium]